MLLSAMGTGYRYFTTKESGNRQEPWGVAFAAMVPF
jgi:uncharacterized membrane protein YjjB (DUF3815 family)